MGGGVLELDCTKDTEIWDPFCMIGYHAKFHMVPIITIATKDWVQGEKLANVPDVEDCCVVFWSLVSLEGNTTVQWTYTSRRRG